MRKYAFILFVALALTSQAKSAFADKEAVNEKKIACPDTTLSKAEKFKAKLDDLTAKLTLTAEQQTQVTEILTKAKEDSKAVWVEAKGKIKEIRSKAHDVIAGLLTDEQKEKFKEVRKECEAQKPEEHD